jgi:hypothetical protein
MILLLVLLAQASGAQQAAPPTSAPAANPAVPDAALLERLEQVLRAARQFGEELWPGWKPAATPLAVFKGAQMTVLVGHPAPPANFHRFPTSAVSAPVFVADSTTGFLRANTAQPFAGTLTAFFAHDGFMKPAAAEGIALALHELFHAELSRVAPRKVGNSLVVLWGDYPEFSARNRALLTLEAQLLYRAAAAEEAQARGNAALFLGMRAERRKQLTAELAAYESGEESSEGLARYIEWRALGLLPRLGGEFKEAGAAAANRLEPLKNINKLGRDRERFYALGLAQAIALDRLRPRWKQEFASTPALLDELLARAAPAASAEETTRVVEKLSFNRLLAEQEKALTERQEQGEARLVALASVPDRQRLVVEIGELKIRPSLRGFNPNGAVLLTPGQVLHDFLLLDLGSDPAQRVRLEFRGVFALYDRPQNAIWCLLPAEAITQALEAFTRAPAGAGLVVQAPGFRGEFTGVQVERRGGELRIRPLQDLIKKPQLALPTFVRP